MPVGYWFLSRIVGIEWNIFKSYFIFDASIKTKIYSNICFSIYSHKFYFGIMGQFTKTQVVIEIGNYWYLFAIVLLGGLIGNFMNLKFIPTRILAFITSCLVIFVSLRVGLKYYNLN